MTSLFSRIIAGEIPASVVFREERWIGILDLFPVAPGHLLLIPVEEQPLVQELTASTQADIGRLIGRATTTLRQALSCDAVSVLLRDGAAAGQEIPHVHIHCIPRSLGDEPHTFVGGRYSANDNAAQEAMAAMRERLSTVWQELEV